MRLVDRAVQEERERELLAPWGMRSAESRGRRYPEPEHPMRTCFQRDRDRIIHSSSFRRLEYKTQVFVNHEGDNYRTRLTHSLEGAQIGRTVARAMGLNEELTECPGAGPRPRAHAVRPLRRAGDERADARARRLRAQPADAAHPRGARAALPGVPGPQPHLGGARGDHQAPAGHGRDRAAGVRAGGGAHPRGAARRLRGRDRLQQPRRGRRADLGDVHGGADPRGDALPGGARRRAGPGLRGGADRPAPRGPLDHRPLRAGPHRDEPGEPGRRARAARWPTCVRRGGGSWPTGRRWRRGCAS